MSFLHCGAPYVTFFESVDDALATAVDVARAGNKKVLRTRSRPIFFHLM